MAALRDASRPHFALLGQRLLTRRTASTVAFGAATSEANGRFVRVAAVGPARDAATGETAPKDSRRGVAAGLARAHTSAARVGADFPRGNAGFRTHVDSCFLTLEGPQKEACMAS